MSTQATAGALAAAISGWSAGERCERHYLAHCADCRDLAGIVRNSDGSLGLGADCAVQTFTEILGCSYEEALEALLAAGYRVGAGTPAGEGLAKAFSSVGFRVSGAAGMTPDEALAISARSGRCFYVEGFKGRKGHAWSIVGGRANRPYRPPFRYRLCEVVA